MNPRLRFLPALIVVLLLALPQTAFAHVKWFSDFSFAIRPLTLAETVTPTFIGLALLSVAVISAMVLIDRQLDAVGWYGRINQWLSAREVHSLTVMRIAMAAVLLISWENNALLAPELAVGANWISWFEFLLAILLLFPQTTPAAGIGLLVLYVLAIGQYGMFHMLDYLHYVGIGIYLFVSQHRDSRLKGIGLPALYATIGFALIWLAWEKLVYPDWSFYLLEQNPQLTLGLPFDFFLQSAAFVEISLGFLLLIGLLERPLAAIITLVFFTTTLIFSRIEVIGHTPIHAALVVFLLSGPGNFYKAPIAIHKKLNWRITFAAVNFVLVMMIIGSIYTASAKAQYDVAVTAAEVSGSVGISAETHTTNE